MDRVTSILQNLCQEYKDAVSQNSASIAQFESAFRLVSYAVGITGTFEDSTILSELLYSASNLLVLFNDAIIQKASGILPKVTTSKERLQSLVTVLEYVGVFVEMAGSRLYGEPGRWIAITVLQIAKCVCRFLVFVVHNVGIQTVPPISPIDRNSVLKHNETEKAVEIEDEKQNGIAVLKGKKTPEVFALKRSGKSMRTLSKGLAINMRDWKLPKPADSNSTDGAERPSELTRMQAWAESIYIVKPLIHLMSMYACGTASFKPWLISSGLDVGSLYLMKESRNLNPQEKAELRRRTLMLTMYLLRSPFYDKYTKHKLLNFIHGFSQKIPGVSMIANPLIEYLPYWQQMYFYTWSM